MRLTITLAAIFLVSFMESCYYDNLEELRPDPLFSTTDCDSSKASIAFNADVLPILKNNCGANSPCHNSPNSNSGINLSSYTECKTLGSNGKLVGSVVWDGTASNMPKGSNSKISDCNIAIIKKWVTSGMAQ